MNHLLRIISWQWRHSRSAFMLGLAVALIPALAGIALLGVAGWFITAAALAGLAGVTLNIFVPSALIRGLAVARTAGRYGERLLTHDATFRFLTNLRRRVFRKQAAKFGDGAQPACDGAALNRLTSDIEALDAIYLRLTVPAVLSAVSALLVVLWAVSLAPVAALGLAGLSFWSAALVFYLLTKREIKTARRLEAAQDALRLRSVDLVAGRRDLAVYGGLDDAAEHVMHAETRLSDALEAINKRIAWLVAANSFAGQFFLAVTLVLGCLLIAGGQIGPAWAVALVLVAMALPEVLGGTVPGLANLQRTQLAARRASADMEEQQDPAAGPAGLVGGTDAAQGPVLSFQSVSFSYPRAALEVFSDLSFEISKGEVVSLTGRSGCGKSTVSALAARLLRPASGTIHLQGRDLTHLPEEHLRKTVTVLGQKPYLFNDTIAANLRIANPDASDDDLWTALDMAALSPRIRDSGQGLETVLGEGGLGLSGGEQRRLGLARAYLTRPALFILDEMTEGLDADTAEDVLNRFDAFRGEAAVLMIAHKQAEIARADRILGLTEPAGRLAAE